MPERSAIRLNKVRRRLSPFSIRRPKSRKASCTSWGGSAVAIRLMKASVMAVLAACEVHGNAEGTPNGISPVVYPDGRTGFRNATGAKVYSMNGRILERGRPRGFRHTQP